MVASWSKPLSKTVGTLICSTGIISAGVVLVPLVPNVAHAQEGSSSMVPGSFACINNPNPVCENVERDISSENWLCSNNPGPDCAAPPRVEEDLESGSWSCVNNHNAAVCENPIRYTVEDPDTWADRFSSAGNE